MSDYWFYDLINADQTLSKLMVSNGVSLTDLRYVKDIINTRIGMFTYERLPEGLTSEILETCLMFRSRLCFYYKPEVTKWYLGIYKSEGEFGVYRKPDTVSVQAINGASLGENVPYKDIILVRDNSMDIIPFVPVLEYIVKIKNLEDDIFKIADIASLPVVITGNKKLANQAKMLAQKLGHKNAFILGDDTLINSVQQFDIHLPINPLDLYELKNKYRNECLGSLGIYSSDSKRERSLNIEIKNQNDFTDFVYQNAKMQRELFVKQMNARGCDIIFKETYDVNYKEGVEEEAMQAHAVAVAENVGGDKNDKLS